MLNYHCNIQSIAFDLLCQSSQLFFITNCKHLNIVLGLYILYKCFSYKVVAVGILVKQCAVKK